MSSLDFLNFRPNCHPEFFTLYLLACSYYSKLKAFTPQGLTRMQCTRLIGKMLKQVQHDSFVILLPTKTDKKIHCILTLGLRRKNSRFDNQKLQVKLCLTLFFCQALPDLQTCLLILWHFFKTRQKSFFLVFYISKFFSNTKCRIIRAGMFIYHVISCWWQKEIPYPFKNIFWSWLRI